LAQRRRKQERTKSGWQVHILCINDDDDDDDDDDGASL
jgi:hypothetical protein